MITDAALYLKNGGDVSAALGLVAGRPLAFRALMAAVRAGCRRVYLSQSLRGPDLERAIAGTPSARTAIVWIERDAAPPGRPLLLLPAAALVPARALAPLLRVTPLALLAASRPCAPVMTIGTALASELWRSIATGRPLGDALDRALKDGRVVEIAGPDRYLHAISPADRRAAEAQLAADLPSPIDTWLDRALHRRLSRPLSRRAAAWGIQPNHVTLASLVVGLAAVWCFWQATPARALLGLALYAIAVVLDHADGEVARLSLAETPFGARLDVAVDTAIHALLVVAMGVTAERLGGHGAALAGVIAAIGVGASAALTSAAPSARGGPLGALLDMLGNRDGFYVMLGLFIVGLVLQPRALPGLMIFLAVACHAFWLSWLAHRRFPPRP